MVGVVMLSWHMPQHGYMAMWFMLRQNGGLQVGRAGRFGTKGLAIPFVSYEADSLVLNQVRQVVQYFLPSSPHIGICG